MSKIKNTEFEHFTEHLKDVIFEQTSEYLTDVTGCEDWGEELHNAHGIVMWNAVAKIAKDMGLKKHFKDE